MQNHSNTSNVETHSKSPPTFSQIAVVASKLPVANNFPEGDQAQDLTVLVCVSSKTACKFQLKITVQSALLQSTKFGNQTLSCFANYSTREQALNFISYNPAARLQRNSHMIMTNIPSGLAAVRPFQGSSLDNQSTSFQ